MLGGAALAVAGLTAPWTRVTLEPTPFLEGDTVTAPGWAPTAGGWVAGALVTIVTVFVVLAMVGPAHPRGLAHVVWAAGATTVWGIARVVMVARRLEELSDPAFNTTATLGWGAWTFVLGSIVVLIVASVSRARSPSGGGRLLESRRGHASTGEV